MQQSNVLKLMETHAKQLDEEFQILERKAQQNISISSIIVAVIGALKISDVQAAINDPLLVSIFLIYGLNFLLSYLAQVPRQWTGLPLEPTWEETQRVLGKSEEDFFDWLIAGYVKLIDENTRRLQYKVYLVRAGIVLIGVDMMLIFLAALK